MKGSALNAGVLGGVLYLSLFHGPSFETKYQWQGQLEGKSAL